MLRNMTRRFCRPGLLALAAACAFVTSGALAQARTINKAGGLTQLNRPLFRDYFFRRASRAILEGRENPFLCRGCDREAGDVWRFAE